MNGWRQIQGWIGQANDATRVCWLTLPLLIDRRA